ncbi:tyrosine-type recombinase/integrase [Pseudoalteromonas sp. NGC95]|nr:tyrosine-type recombinase/integrase [Pseudoalteromonas sp. NGC95]
MFSIRIRCGLRRQEVASLKASDVSQKSLRVICKGNKERKVSLHSVVLDAIKSWLEIYKCSNENPLLFVSILKGGHLQNKAMSTDATFKLCNNIMHHYCTLCAAATPPTCIKMGLISKIFLYAWP